MGSSASSESQAHQNPDDREPQGTVKMTVWTKQILAKIFSSFSPFADLFVQISSKFVEPENKGRQNSRERTGNAQSQRQQRAESSNEGSGAQRPQQKRSNNASTQAIQGFGSNISPSNYESTLEADLEAIKDLVSSVKVPENPKPHLSDKIADVARETMESSTKKLEIEETAVINEVQNLFTKINAVPQYVT